MLGELALTLRDRRTPHGALSPRVVLLSTAPDDPEPMCVKLLDEATAPPGWSALAIVRGLDERDVWAIGLIAYWLYTGRAFFEDTASVEGEIPLASRRHGAVLPSGFDAWFARAVTHNRPVAYLHPHHAFSSFQPMTKEDLGERTAWRAAPVIPPGIMPPRTAGVPAMVQPKKR